MRHLALFEIRRGFFRGSHYHEKKEEVFYVFQGKMRAVFLDMDNQEKEEALLKKGDKIRIKPRCGHIFMARKIRSWLNTALRYSIRRTITESVYPNHRISRGLSEYRFSSRNRPTSSELLGQPECHF